MSGYDQEYANITICSGHSYRYRRKSIKMSRGLTSMATTNGRGGFNPKN